MTAPTNPLINRLRDLLYLLPEGYFYDKQGEILPYRSSPYVLQFTTEVPNHIFGLFLNGQFQGQLQTDPAGNLTASVQLVLGENRVDLVDGVTQERTRLNVTTRKYAVWLAAYADALTQIDNVIDEINQASHLEECPGQDLPIVWGPRTQLPQPAGWDIEVYREVMQELHLGQRLFGAKTRGHEVGLAALTQVPPIDIFRLFRGRRWMVGYDFLANPNFAICSHRALPDPGIPGVTGLTFSPTASTGSGVLVFTASPSPTLTYQDPVFGDISLPATTPGPLTFFSPPQAPQLASLAGPFAIAAGINDALAFDLDGLGMISVTLPPGGAVTAASLVAAINAALAADVRYGTPYGAAAVLAPGTTAFHLVGGAAADGRIAGYPSLASAWPTVFGKSVAGGTLPFAVLAYVDPLLTVTLTPAAYGGLLEKTFTVYAAPVPDGWFAEGSAALTRSPAPPFGNSIRVLSLTPEPSSTEVALFTAPLPEAGDYRGFPFTLSAWIGTLAAGCTAFLGWSFDGGATWTEAPGAAIPVLPDPASLPAFFSASFVFDPDATALLVRLRVTTGTDADVIEVHRLGLEQPNINGLYLKTSTIARSRHRSFFGHLLWTWCPDALVPLEASYAGLGAPPDTPKGQLDFLSAAHTQLDRFDVTERDFLGNPINLFGPCTEADWALATLTNLALVPRSPSRFTYAAPTVAGPLTTPALTFSDASPFTASLAVVSDENLLTSILLENGVPLTQDHWTYTSPTSIVVDDASFDDTAVYTLIYQPLYQVVSGVIDLGPAWGNYVWYVDTYEYVRFSATVAEVTVTRPLFVDLGTFTATLDRPANPDPHSAQILRVYGADQEILGEDTWTFSNPYTISFDGSVILAGAQYILTYQEQGMINAAQVTATLEKRSAADPVSLLSASWVPTSRQAPLKTTAGLRYHQLRWTFQGIEDVRDLRARSLVIKGLNVFGPTGSIPGLRP